MGFHDWALQLRFYLFYCFLSVVLAVECQSWLNVTRLWGEKYTLEAHKYQPKRPCYRFSTLPVFSVHVTFVCRAECFTGVRTCENNVKSPPG